MNRIFKSIKTKVTKVAEFDKPVQNGLAVTPSQMLDMTNRGIPVAASNLGLAYDEGYSDLDFTPPLQHQRGVDIADMWEKRQDLRSKISSKEFQQFLEKKGGE